MLKAAICDDEQPIREYLKELIEKRTKAEVSTFASGEEFLRSESHTAYDIILLDISLDKADDANGLNGMDVARRIRETSDTIIIFVTALKEYVFEGYDVGAFNYLLKPIDEQKFIEVMDKAIEQITKKRPAEPLLIKTEGSYIKIPVENIIYAENEARKVVLHTKNMKEETYSFYEKMEVLEHKLGNGFLRSHRGFLVNLQEIEEYDNANIRLKNGETIFLSKQKYNSFVTAYMDYLRRQ